MKTVFLIDGAAGTGKSDMLKYISLRKRTTATLIPKYTTRKKRAEEKNIKLDLRFPEDTRDQFMKRTEDNNFYWYIYGNHKAGDEYYGFYKENIDEALKKFDFVLIIVRDRETISTIKRDYSSIRVISIFVYADRDLIVERLKQDDYTDETISNRLNRQPLAWNDYLKYSSEYDEIVINSSRHEEYEILLEALFQKYNTDRSDLLEISPIHTYQIIPPLIGYKHLIEQKLEKYPFHRNVFLMMKFRGEKNSRVYQYIKKTLATHGFNCVRADESIWDITRNTYNPVAVLYCCQYGIALFDEPEKGNDYSPNVAYELGIMHNQGKECLVLRNSSIENVPFDLVKELYVDYQDNLELEEIIEAWTSKIKDE